MKHPPTTLADLSQFTIQQMVQQSDHSLLSGRITKPGRLSSGEHLSVFISLKENARGVLTELDPDAALAVLSVNAKNLHPALVIGATFPVYDAYWARKLPLALDDDIHWTRMQFVPLDAFVEPSENAGWRKWRIATPDDSKRTDGRIVPGGWDHEHCELCWHKMGPAGDSDGYFSGAKQWVCVSCYDCFIQPRNLQFVMEGDWGDSDNPASSLTVFQQINRLIDNYDLHAIRRFLDDAGKVDVRNKFGWTPLMLAASRGHQSLIALLLDVGADVNAVSEQHGYTVLALAAQKGYALVVEKLLGTGARVEVPDTFCGGSLLTYVKTGPGRENARVSKLLTDAGAK
jgi:hypothetical protein